MLANTVFAPLDTHGASVSRYGIKSRLTDGTRAQVLIAPPGSPSTGRPLLVFLHGKGGGPESNLNSELFEELHALGPQAPDVLLPDGGEDSYWHDRDDGAWARYVMSEAIPQAIAKLHADPKRIAIGGISMGGFGAYDIARLHPGRFCAVGGHSAAIWESGGESAEGAFDNAEDFARHDLIARADGNPDAYPGPGGKPSALWLDVGTLDPFRRADTRLVEELRADGRTVSFHVWAGGHESSYWHRHFAAYVRFYADALASCGN
ncbi:MAG TPA: alpha/beta hydrolase-fold protein [Solirubrobacteraceae bacterium]|nr:alpha/beta hydrolase-fold protein [Solirubrobacteraceae bacterium]